MASRIRLFNRAGSLLTEVDAPAFREWIINDVGSAKFTIKAVGMESYIQNGNYITIEHDKLDTWVGVIVNPRPWSPKVVEVNAKSAMSLFQWRVGSYEQSVQGSWGAVFSQLIGIVNSAENTLLQIGTYDDGVSYSSIVDMSNVYTYLQRALTQSQSRLDFRPVVNRGKLTIYIDMKPSLYEASKLDLQEGLNIKDTTSVLVEQGDIYNDVTVIGVGLDQAKLTARATNPASIARYGLRQVLFSEGQSQTDVDRIAIVRLAQYAFPRSTLGLLTLDEGRTFLDLRIGNSGRVQLRTMGYKNGALGFDGQAYLRALQYDDKTGEAVSICEEIVNG